MSKKQDKIKYKVAHNSKEALELLKKAKKGESILWDERTPCKVIHEWFTKTNNSQQDLKVEALKDKQTLSRACLEPRSSESNTTFREKGARRMDTQTPADIHNREQEFDLIEKALMFKPILNPNQMAMFHRYIKQAELKGIKLGKQIRKDEIMKIIKRRIKFWTPTRYTLNVDPCRNKKVELEELEEEITKQKIKGGRK